MKGLAHQIKVSVYIVVNTCTSTVVLINDREEVMSPRAETKDRPLEDILVLNLYHVGGGRE